MMMQHRFNQQSKDKMHTNNNHHRAMLFRKRLHALFQEKGIRRNLVVACVVVAIVSGALLSDIDVVFVGRTRERDLNAVCKKTQNTHNDWDAREAFEASEKIERNIRARVSAAREDASITISGKKKEEFTIVLNTFKRRDLLQRSLRHYVRCKDSGKASIKEIRVVWSEQVPVPSIIEGDDETAYALDRPEFVKYDKHVGSTSIQNRFQKIDALKTEAVFHVDDDVRIPCGKLEKGFRKWQSNKEGLVGYFGRMHKLESRNEGTDGTCKMRYAWNDFELFFTSKKRYSIALTKAAFSHAKYLELYSSEYLPDGVREYIDSRKNCEDIAMQMLVSSVVSEKNKREMKRKKGYKAAVAISSGWMHYVAGKIDSLFVDGISSGQGHHDERSGCVTDFSRMFGGGSPLDTVE